MGERIMVSRRSIMASWQCFWLETFARLVGLLRVAQLAVATLGTIGSVTGDRWTQQKLLVNITTHTTFTQSNLSVSSAVVNPSFSGRSKLEGASFAASGSATQKPVHCTGLLARKISDKNADMNHDAVPPPECQAGGDTRRDNLCQQDSARVNKTTPRASSSGQLEAAGPSSSGRLVAAEDPSIEKKVHLHPKTHGEKYIRKFDDPVRKFEPQNEEEHELTIKY